MTDPILEAAARALSNCIEGYQSIAVVAAVTPLIRAQVLEEAAKVVKDYDTTGLTVYELQCGIASRIRALKEQP